MFGMKKKEPKVEKVFDNTSNQETDNLEQTDVFENTENMTDDEKLILGVEDKKEEIKKEDLSDSQKRQMEQLGSVKDKISKILKSSNIEIIDENIGDEYEDEESSTKEKSEEDYDALRALFAGNDDKNKELTLTIDDFDYTYTGRYLDEFDMMHLRNIKRIRLQNKHAKLIKKISLIASIVLFVIGGALAAFFLTREQPVYLKSISLNQQEAVYYINDYFDYSGLYILAEYSNGVKEQVKLSPTHLKDMIGNIVQNGDTIQFTGTAPAQLTFSYGGINVNYNVSVENRREVGIAAIYSDGLFNLSQDDYINSDNLKLLHKYSNFNSTYFNYDNTNVKIYINGVACSYDSTKNAFLASASTKPDMPGENSTARIIVVYGEYQLILTYKEGINYQEM